MQMNEAGHGPSVTRLVLHPQAYCLVCDFLVCDFLVRYFRPRVGEERD